MPEEALPREEKPMCTQAAEKLSEDDGRRKRTASPREQLRSPEHSGAVKQLSSSDEQVTSPQGDSDGQAAEGAGSLLSTLDTKGSSRKGKKPDIKSLIEKSAGIMSKVGEFLQNVKEDEPCVPRAASPDESETSVDENEEILPRVIDERFLAAEGRSSVRIVLDLSRLLLRESKVFERSQECLGAIRTVLLELALYTLSVAGSVNDSQEHQVSGIDILSVQCFIFIFLFFC